jgi:transcriptional regulator with XRE-family HTH domain
VGGVSCNVLHPQFQREPNMDAIKQLRKINKNLSYDKIAQEMNVSTQSIYRWIKGKTSPSAMALEKIQKYVLKKSKIS